MSSTSHLLLAGLTLILLLPNQTVADRDDDEFKQCCLQLGMTHMELCKYPPEVNISDAGQIEDLGSHYPGWMKCYTNGKDNTQCCHQAGVDAGSNALCLVRI